MNEKEPILQKHYEQIRQAFLGTSFSPEKRAKDYIASYSKLLEEDLEIIRQYNGDEERYTESFISYFLTWMRAKSNCLSTMITGGSNFPVKRAEKANNRERSASEAFSRLRERSFASVKRIYNANIRASQDPVEEAKKNVKKESDLLSKMKEANKVIRSKKLSDEEKIEKLKDQGIEPKEIIKRMSGDYAGRLGYPSYELTNCRGRLKNNEARLAQLEKRASGNAEEETFGDIKVIHNEPENRIQIFFDGKPDFEIRKALKSNGFRWTPSKGCWQCYNSDNGKWKYQNKIKPILGQ